MDYWNQHTLAWLKPVQMRFAIVSMQKLYVSMNQRHAAKIPANPTHPGLCHFQQEAAVNQDQDLLPQEQFLS